MELELHPVQAKILNILLFKTEARFSDLNIEGLTSDHFVFHCTNVKGTLLESFEGGCNVWASKKEILALDNLFDGVEESIRLTKSKEVKFVEAKYKVKGF